MPEEQLPGQGVSDQQQEALTHLGKMMGPQSDSFDDEVQAKLNEHHKAEHDATDYEAVYGGDRPERPHERSYQKMKAAQTGGSEGLGPSEAEATLAKQRASLQQQAAGAGQAQAAQAQAQMSPPATPPPAPAGSAGVSAPYSAQAGATGGSGQAPPGTGTPGGAPSAPGEEQAQGPPSE